MFRQLFVCLCIAAPVSAGAQQPVLPDTTKPDSATRAADSVRSRAAARLKVVTITATPVKREESRQAVAVTPEDIARTPATSPWEMLRQTAGVEVHVQGQGPGFASDASVRGFSSDHSTDLALWIDGVPVNEPVNGHAEGYNDWSLIFPQVIQSLDVIKGPTSALFGNFAFSGIVNVRTLDQLDGTHAWINGGSAGHVEGRNEPASPVADHHEQKVISSRIQAFDESAPAAVATARAKRYAPSPVVEAARLFRPAPAGRA